ncbi:MAG: hypothetical protein IKY19_09495 [Bacteroidaceae bacterium]|nr:hypothetical protein [Bacteroidaceae bacterium]
MRKRYCSPVAESIGIEIFIIAASTANTAAASRNVSGMDGDERTGSWGGIWE